MAKRATRKASKRKAKKKPVKKKAANRRKTPQNTKKSGPSRASDGRFEPGRSGNPGGRPKMPDDVKQIFSERTPEAARALFDLIKNRRVSAMARVKALALAFAYALGKPTQSFEFSGPGGGDIPLGSPVDLSKLSRDELHTLRGLVAKAAN